MYHSKKDSFFFLLLIIVYFENHQIDWRLNKQSSALETSTQSNAPHSRSIIYDIATIFKSGIIEVKISVTSVNIMGICGLGSH